jgi:glutathione S-transferase
MSLTLYFHPLSSYCHKALIALYENDTAFEPRIVNLMDPAEAAAFKKVWPCAQFPVLRDDTRDRTIPESSVIIEYLDRHHPGKTKLLPADPDRALEVRLKDRFYDLHLHVHMQKVVGDRLRPADKKDPLGVEQARARMLVSLDMIDAEMAGRTWAMGDEFTMADCAAGPPLFYIDKVFPLAGKHRHAAAYLGRLMQRPSYARALEEAKPYFSMLPI